MSEHSYTRLWMHAMFSTLDQAPLISPAQAAQIEAHLKAQLIECRCPVHAIRCMPDHVHILFLLHPEAILTQVMKQIKGHTSHWYNSNQLTEAKLCWQKGFNVFSLSDQQVQQTMTRIAKQEQIHLTRSYRQELDEIVAENGSVMPDLS